MARGLVVIGQRGRRQLTKGSAPRQARRFAFCGHRATRMDNWRPALHREKVTKPFILITR